jgi:hypothetical protein
MSQKNRRASTRTYDDDTHTHTVDETRNATSATDDEEMSPAERAAIKRVNHDSDKHYQPTVATAAGRDPNADVSMLEETPALRGDGSEISKAERVGLRAPSDPRARMAGALHDALDGRAVSDLSSDELSDVAASIGLAVDGTGAHGAVLQSDLVRALNALAYRYPKKPEAE